MGTDAERENLVQALCIANVLAERNRQDAKWGVQNHDPMMWTAILTEEVGELAQASLNKSMNDFKAEAIQCAAVALAIVEWIERGAP